MLGIKTPEVTAGVAAFLERCQTYEGGIGGEPGAEAHGGYAFCGIATHVLLDCNSRLDPRRLLVRSLNPAPTFSPTCPPLPHTCGPSIHTSNPSPSPNPTPRSAQPMRVAQARVGASEKRERDGRR